MLLVFTGAPTSAQLALQKCQINVKLSAKYHKKAFLMGNTESLVDLVWLLQRGGFGLTKDPFKAFEWLNKADFAKNTDDTFRLVQAPWAWHRQKMQLNRAPRGSCTSSRRWNLHVITTSVGIYSVASKNWSAERKGEGASFDK